MEITHIVMIRFQKDFLTDEYFNYTTAVFHDMKEQIPGILSAKVRRNCIPRDGNYDVMIEMELADASILSHYLGHPLHIAFADSHKGKLVSRASFDYSAG